MDTNLRGRVAAVMGGSAGIGKAVAAGLAAEGAHVVLMARNQDVLDEAARDIGSVSDVEVMVQSVDHTDAAQVERAAAAVAERFPTLNILVNSAGHRMRRLDRQILWDDEDWKADVDAKLFGMLRTVRSFLPHMATDGTGRVINVGGISSIILWESALTHGLNNAAVEEAGKYLARDLAPNNITVNTVIPGLIGVEWRQVWAATMAQKADTDVETFLQEYCAGKGVVLGRWGDPGEVADAVTFLASDRAKYMTGTSLVVDGGMSINSR